VSQLQEYDLELKHRPGRLHGAADFLSRLLNVDKGEQDNEQVIGIPDKYWSNDTSLLDITPIDVQVTKIFDLTDRAKIIAEYHDNPLEGHPGENKTIELIQRDFIWDTLEDDVRAYVKGCPPCQMNKLHRYKPKAPLHPVNPGPTLFQHLSTDMISPLPHSDGFNAILVIVDKSSKKAVFIPTYDALTSQEFAELLVSHWIRHFGVPLTITSDRGPQFVNKFIAAFYEACGIEGTPSTAYHPQTDGQTE
jgi:hypothetical protein